jgi:hypothetical protein
VSCITFLLVTICWGIYFSSYDHALFEPAPAEKNITFTPPTLNFDILTIKGKNMTYNNALVNGSVIYLRRDSRKPVGIMIKS